MTFEQVLVRVVFAMLVFVWIFIGAGCVSAPSVPSLAQPVIAVPQRLTLDRPAPVVPGFQVAAPTKGGTIDRESNLVVGFDADNLRRFGASVEAIDAHVKQLNDRVDAANAERDYWRQRAAGGLGQ